jgi:hypothetical protein
MQKLTENCSFVTYIWLKLLQLLYVPHSMSLCFLYANEEA